MGAGLFNRISALLRDAHKDLIGEGTPDQHETTAQKRFNEALAEIRASLGRATAAQHRLTKEHEQKLSDLQGLEERAEFALAEGREDLARAAIRQKVGLQNAVEAAKTELHTLAQEIDDLNDLMARFGGELGEDPAISEKLAELESLLQRSNERKG